MEIRPRMRTARDVAQYFAQNDPETRVTYSSILKDIKMGNLPAVKNGNRYLINLDNAEAYYGQISAISARQRTAAELTLDEVM